MAGFWSGVPGRRLYLNIIEDQLQGLSSYKINCDLGQERVKGGSLKKVQKE